MPAQALWNDKFMLLARLIASWSRDPETGVGCILADWDNIVRSTGYNGLPRGVKEEGKRNERPEKYLWIEHAERNAIYNAARVGIALEGCRVFVYGGFPCADCARAIVQCGIVEVVASPPDVDDERWGGHYRVAIAILDEGSVRVTPYSRSTLGHRL
jgi:dCMP deaminase